MSVCVQKGVCLPNPEYFPVYYGIKVKKNFGQNFIVLNHSEKFNFTRFFFWFSLVTLGQNYAKIEWKIYSKRPLIFHYS